jgi:hypothetical protein
MSEDNLNITIEEIKLIGRGGREISFTCIPINNVITISLKGKTLYKDGNRLGKRKSLHYLNLKKEDPKIFFVDESI